jgi:hypothetical protein
MNELDIKIDKELKKIPDLPIFLAPFFWDYDFRDLSWDSDRDLIIARILSAGDWSSITWVRGNAGSDQLREWIMSRKGRGLDRRQLRFWELILDLDHKIVDIWMKERDGNIWDERTHR